MIPGSNNGEYQKLVGQFPPRPIRSEPELAATEARIGELLALPRRSPAEEDYLDLLTQLVRTWEDEHVEIPPLSGVELVKELCRERGISRGALVPIFGTRSIVSEVLANKRELQRKHIEALAQFFHVSPAAFFPTASRSANPVP
jgi:HTH-type transcriptional regulator/antitoxin HigA